jgi:predicted NACHT family NTPase
VDLGPVRLPVLLRLTDYERWRWDATGHDTGRPLIDYLGRHPWLQQPMHPDPSVGHAIVLDYLRRGAVLLLFDGLDEIVEPGRRGDIVVAVETFLRTWARAPHSGRCPRMRGLYRRKRWRSARIKVPATN